jgi:hypothetical protein
MILPRLESSRCDVQWGRRAAVPAESVLVGLEDAEFFD